MASDWKTPLPDSRAHPRYAGVSTFCRYPLLGALEAQQREQLDWILYGCPYDGGVSYRPGARFGPRAIRDASQYVKAHHLEHDVNVPRTLGLCDAGDAPIEAPYDCEQALQAMASWAKALPGAGCAKLLAVGGDHSIALANLRATCARLGQGPLALLHFDAHIDTLDSLWGQRYSHASPFRRAFEEGLVDPSRMLSIGLRGPVNTPADFEEARALGVETVTCRQWRSGEGAQRLAAFLRRIEGQACYLSFDIDCMDPSCAPGTGTPAPGGFLPHEMLQLLQGLAGVRLAGADVVETLPERDPAGVTAFLAAHVLFEILALDAAQRRSG